MDSEFDTNLDGAAIKVIGVGGSVKSLLTV